jgi:hypothetical protein
MGFGQSAPRPVPFGPPAGTHLHRQPESLKPMIQRPAARVDRGRVLQRPARLGLHVRMPILLGGLRPLGVVARLTGKREVAHPIGAAARPGHKVLDLERHAGRATVGAPAPKLLQQVFTDLIAGQLPLLIRCASDLGLLQELGVKADEFLREGGDWGEPAEPSHPGLHVAHPGGEGGWQPPVRSTAVVQARGAVAGVAVPPPAANGTAGQQGVSNPLPPMPHLAGPCDLATAVVYQREASGSAARIHLQPERHWLRIRHRALEDDRERITPQDGGLPGCEQPPRPRWMAGRERPLFRVHDKDRHHAHVPFQCPVGWPWLPRYGSPRHR